MARSSLFIVTISVSILLGIVTAWWPDLDFAIALEDSPFAWLQSSLLVACGCVVGIRALIESGMQQTARQPRREKRWLLVALMLIATALDERFMGHERIQEYIYFDLLHGDPSLKQWTQAVTAVYGVVGIGVLLWLRQSMQASAWAWCKAGVMVGLAAITLDIAIDSVKAQIIEELLEATAETLFLCGLFMEVRSSVSQQHSVERLDPAA